MEEKLKSSDAKGKESEARQVPKRFRDNLYERINIPLKTMDIIIGILIVFLLIFLAAGILQAN